MEDYLIGGRRYKNLHVALLKEAWHAVGSRARNARNGADVLGALGAMNDIEAEFNLRGLEAPGRIRH